VLLFRFLFTLVGFIPFRLFLLVILLLSVIFFLLGLVFLLLIFFFLLLSLFLLRSLVAILFESFLLSVFSLVVCLLFRFWTRTILK